MNSNTATLSNMPKSGSQWKCFSSVWFWLGHTLLLCRCIKMHHGYISSHILVRTACQGLFPLGSMWQGIKLCQQFRPMIDGIQALNCGAHGVPSPTRYTCTLSRTWSSSLDLSCVQYWKERTRKQNALTLCSNRTIRASERVARSLNQDAKPHNEP